MKSASKDGVQEENSSSQKCHKIAGLNLVKQHEKILMNTGSTSFGQMNSNQILWIK